MDAGGVAQIRPTNACKGGQELTGGQLACERGVVAGFGPDHLPRQTLFAATDTSGGPGTPCLALFDFRLPVSLGRQFVDGGFFCRPRQPDERLRGCASRFDAERAICLLADPHFIASL
jgi:hypothetical protein